MEEAITSVFYSISVAKGLQTMAQLSYLAVSVASILKVPLFGDSNATERAHLLTSKFKLIPEYGSSPEDISHMKILLYLQWLIVSKMMMAKISE